MRTIPIIIVVVILSTLLGGCTLQNTDKNTTAQENAFQKTQENNRTELVIPEFKMMGSSDAPITFVEFSDYECPFCKKFTTTVLPDIIKEYVDTGIVKFYFTDFPLEIHEGGKIAAIAARCAGYQDKYYVMHDLLFERSKEIGRENIELRAQELGLDTELFTTCLTDPEEMSKLLTDINQIKELGVTGTPSFMINGKIIKGAQPFAAFKQIIEAEGNNILTIETVQDAVCTKDADCKSPSTFPSYCSETDLATVCTTSGTPTCILGGTAESECVMMITEVCTPCDEGMRCTEGACVSFTE